MAHVTPPPIPAEKALCLGLAYNLLFEIQRVLNPTLTFAEFDKWLHATVVGKVKAAKALVAAKGA